MSRWRPFPHSADAFDYSKDELKAHWDRLHKGDCEPLPADESVIEAWRAFHRGDFEKAWTLGNEAGGDGAYVANKAAGIHAVYLVDDESEQLETFQKIAARCEEAQKTRPDDPNAFYFHSYALGRYGQGISIAKALAQGLGGIVKASFDRTLTLQPKHADAHIGVGLYHAEIVAKVGKMIAKLTYGATADKALTHLKKANDLFPESAIAKIEYANGLLALDEDRYYDQASDLYVAAAETEPADAMECLDVKLAQSELE